MSPFPTIANFRDVGQTINDFTGHNLVRTGLFYRAARLDDSSLADRDQLRKHTSMRTVIDLRTSSEDKQQMDKREARIKATSGGIANTEAIRPLQIDGLDYVKVNLNGHAYSWFLMKFLSWYDISRLVFLMAAGYRLQAISILGEKVIRPRGLVRLALDSLDVCKSEVKALFDIFQDSTRYPIVVHCTQGKDRTGLTIVLVLLLLNVDAQAINHDYMLSGPELAGEREDKLREVRSIGLPDEFADCDPQLVERVQEHINGTYGSVEDYLESTGVGKQCQERVKAALLASS